MFRHSLYSHILGKGDLINSGQFLYGVNLPLPGVSRSSRAMSSTRISRQLAFKQFLSASVEAHLMVRDASGNLVATGHSQSCFKAPNEP